MNATLLSLAAAAAAMCLCAGAAAQGSPAVDCLNDGKVGASGTEAAGPAATETKVSPAAAARAQRTVRERGTLPVVFPTCAAKTDRTARAECVRSAWEARHGVAGERMASASTRRPC